MSNPLSFEPGPEPSPLVPAGIAVVIAVIFAAGYFTGVLTGGLEALPNSVQEHCVSCHLKELP